MTDHNLEALRALRSEDAAVPSEARERGRDRLERLLAKPRTAPTRARRHARAPRPGLVRRVLATIPLLAALACVMAIGAVIVLDHRYRPHEHASAVGQAPRVGNTKADLVSLFAIFRRPQTETERAIVNRQRTDRHSGLPHLDNPDSVRILAPGMVAGSDVFAYLVNHYPPVPPTTTGVQRPTEPPAVCVYYPDIDGGGVACETAALVDKLRTLGSLGPELYGLTPDGVAQVELSFPDKQIPLVVQNNFWQFRVALQSDHTPATPLAVVWKDQPGNAIDPTHAAQRSEPIPGTPRSPNVERTELHVPITVLPGHRIRFTPPSGRHRYEISLSCGKPTFDGALTKALPAGTPATISTKLAAARYRCPVHALLSGEIVDLTLTKAPDSLKGAAHVVIVGRFRMRR